MLQGSANLKCPIVRILPHVNDTILLVSAVALTYGRTRTQRIVAFVAALAAFAYILSVAVCRSSLACF
jgi:uncharacterized membrane protein SirB2